jgi:hypothetical protein
MQTTDEEWKQRFIERLQEKSIAVTTNELEHLAECLCHDSTTIEPEALADVAYKLLTKPDSTWGLLG